VFGLIFTSRWFEIAALGLLVLAIIGGPVPKNIASAWLKFAEILGKINSTIILSIIYIIFLTPVALLFRIFNKKIGRVFLRPQGREHVGKL